MQRWKMTTSLIGLAIGAVLLAPRLFPLHAVEAPPSSPPAVPAPTSLHVAVDVLVPEAPTTRPRGVDLAVVLDTSGSMRDGRLAAAKRALLRLADQLRPTDTLSVVTFADRARVVVPAGPADRERLERTLDRVWDHGGTDLHAGIDQALGALPHRADTARHLVLLSDGEPTVGHKHRSAFETLALEAMNDHVSVHAIALGDATDEALLTLLTERTRGQLLHADEAAQLDASFSQAWRAIEAAPLTGVTLALELPPGVRLSHPTARLEGDTTALVPLGSVVPGQPRRVELGFEVTGTPADGPIATLRYPSVAGQQVSAARSLPLAPGDTRPLPLVFDHATTRRP